jgi:adenosylmethionine-8-amino-7-oxononanoate aminotransferase
MPLAAHPKVRAVRIRGVIAALEIDMPGGYLAEAGRVMRRIAIENGVFLRPLGNVIYALPPYCVSERSLSRIAAAMERSIHAVTTS